ncbi:MAG: endonuclease/exonuclease/phosphatase family protein [Polyangiaceae bacterium]
MATVRVATLNIWNRFGPWEERLVAIRAALATLKPDVLAMQEVLRSPVGAEEFDQARLVGAGFGLDHVAWGRAPEEGGFPVGNAILSRWPLEREAVHPLPMLDADDLRAVTAADVRTPFGVLPVYSTHLCYRLHHGYVREAQVFDLAAFVNGRRVPGHMPPVIMGDFNADPDSQEIRFMRGLVAMQGRSAYFADAFAVAGDGSPGTTFSRSNPFTASWREPNRRIDYVFVGERDERFRGDVLSAAVAFDAMVDGVHPSDHFGVVADVFVGD